MEKPSHKTKGKSCSAGRGREVKTLSRFLQAYFVRSEEMIDGGDDLSLIFRHFVQGLNQCEKRGVYRIWGVSLERERSWILCL